MTNRCNPTLNHNFHCIVYTDTEVYVQANSTLNIHKLFLKGISQQSKDFLSIFLWTGTKVSILLIKIKFRYSVCHKGTARRRRFSHHILPASLGILAIQAVTVGAVLKFRIEIFNLSKCQSNFCTNIFMISKSCKEIITIIKLPPAIYSLLTFS